MKCPRCKSLVFIKLCNPTNWRDEGYVFTVLHETEASFYQHRAVGCEFCMLIWDQLGDCKAKTGSKICDELKAFVVLKCFEGLADSCPDGEVVFIESKLGSTRLYVIRDVPAEYRQPYTEDVYLMDTPDDHTGSLQNLTLVKKWLAHCTQHHPLCITPSPLTIPTRLIDVSNPLVPFLKESQHIQVNKYIALSYSWGVGKKFETKLHNIDRHRLAIPTSELPQTFKDAIKVACDLGYTYLWTDALCIIQDCMDDKAHEIRRMCDIYRFADLTIYAERAENPWAGLFEKRKKTAYQPVEVQLKFQKIGNAVTQKVTLAPQISGMNYLKLRGWIFQEEIFSSRVLKFGKQLSWWCKSSVAREADPQPQEIDHSEMRIGVERFRQSLFNIAGNAPKRYYFEMWYAMVEEYSMRRLTWDADTLRAVDGLATRFQEVHKGTYAEGLWMEDCQYGLGWFASADIYRKPTRKRELAPSWSWASVGKVNISFITQKLEGRSSQGTFKTTYVIRQEVSIAKASGEQCQDKKSQTIYTSEHRLHVHGWLKKLFIRHDPDLVVQKENFVRRVSTDPFDPGADSSSIKRKEPASLLWLNGKFPAAVVDPSSGDSIGEAALDDDEAKPKEEEVWALPLFWMDHLSAVWRVCLLLEKRVLSKAGRPEDPLVYERVGIAVIGDDEWLKSKKDEEANPGQEIVII